MNAATYAQHCAWLPDLRDRRGDTSRAKHLVPRQTPAGRTDHRLLTSMAKDIGACGQPDGTFNQGPARGYDFLASWDNMADDLTPAQKQGMSAFSGMNWHSENGCERWLRRRRLDLEHSSRP